MIIAAAIGEQDIIVPIVEGAVLRLYNLENGKHVDYANPALQLETGRRGAALRFVEEKGAEEFVSPPETFCELSYAKARQTGIRFYRIDKGITFAQFVAQLDGGQLDVLDELPAEDVVPSL